MSVTFYMTILYVDDDPDDRQIFEEAVKSIDSRHICVTAQDGLDALSYLSMHAAPDMIFMDLNMPLMDGMTCLMAIRENKDNDKLPVIIFTTSTNPKDRRQCERLGATDFLLKPFSFVHMREILRTVFDQRQDARLAKRGVSD